MTITSLNVQTNAVTTLDTDAPAFIDPLGFEQQQARRAAAYRDEADPLFFKVQRGEALEQDWLDKVAEIRARYPYPEE
jgi:hypothetical protein